MVVQEMQWKEFLEVKDYNPLRFTPLSNISPSEKKFPVKHHFLYWDIETDSKGVKQFANWRFAKQMEIISYALYNDRTQRYTWYGWKSEWKREDSSDTYESVVPMDSPFRQSFPNYNSQFPLIIKKFPNEKSMHMQFIDDVAAAHCHGIMVFNGRGGIRIIRGRRKWFDGFDSQMFYERCIYLGLEEYMQKLSPIPSNNKKGKLYSRSVKSHDDWEGNDQTKHEIYIKCVPFFDLLFDELILMYTKEEYAMKRKRLQNYMMHYLKCGKVEHKGLSVAELYAKDWQKEMRYNITDVEGMVALNLRLHYIEDVMGRALLYGANPEDGVYASKIHDHINLWKTSKEYIMDSRDNEREDEWEGIIDEKLGGFNLQPHTGLYGYNSPLFLFMLDFSKLYPSCGMTANADTRTKINLRQFHFSSKGLLLEDNVGKYYEWNDCARSPAGFFRKDILSLNTQIYAELIGERKKLQKLEAEYKEKMSKEQDPIKKQLYTDYYLLYHSAQFSYKGLINGKFGADGMEGTRTYDKVVYNTPPAMGQEIIQYVIFEVLPSLGYSVANKRILFSSTDSVLSICHTTESVEKAIEEAEEVTKKVNKAVAEYVEREFNPIKNYVKMDCEKIADVGVIFDMRRYMLNIVAEEGEKGWLIHKDPRPFWKGIEAVRRDAAAITNDIQTHLLDMVRKRCSSNEFTQYIIDLENNYASFKWEYICGRCSISNNTEDIGNGNQRYAAIEKANDLFSKGYTSGDSPCLGEFIKHPAHIDGKYIEAGPLVMAFDEDDEYPLKKLGFDLDYNTLKRKHVIDKVDPILALLGLSYEGIIDTQVGGACDL
jgi:DNA polymerase elongation subunit (family B)